MNSRLLGFYISLTERPWKSLSPSDPVQFEPSRRIKFQFLSLQRANKHFSKQGKMTIKQDAENRLGANKTTTTPLELSGVNELDNDNRVRILGIIDKFRELGINEDISLPQVSKRIYSIETEDSDNSFS